MSNVIVFKANSLVAKVNEAAMSNKISESLDDQIAKMLIQIFGLIGIKEPPSKVNSDILIGYIKRNMSNYKLFEFVLAYEMAINGQLAVDINHYQQFSPAYLSGIMRAYRKHTIEMLRKPELEAPILTEDEKRKIIINGILAAYERRKQGDWIQDTGNPKYDFLDKLKLIPFSADRKRSIYAEVKMNFEKKAYLDATNNPASGDLKSLVQSIKNKTLDDNTLGVIKSLAKEHALNIFLHDCAEMDIDLKEKLK